MLFQMGCAATLPKPLSPPKMQHIPDLIRIDFPEKGQYKIKRSIFSKTHHNFLQQEIELPVKQAQFMDVLEKNGAAKGLVIDGDADYRIAFETFRTLPNRVAAPVIAVGMGAVILVPFGSALMLMPWPDFAAASVKLDVFDAQGAKLATIEESGRFWYCNWGPLLLFSKHGRRQAQRLYETLSERAAVRTLEVIQNDLQKTQLQTPLPEDTEH